MTDRPAVGWYRLGIDEAATQVHANLTQGLTHAEARRRLEQNGPNEVVDRGGRSRWQILVGQLTGILTLVLVAAAAVSVLLQDIIDAIVILAIVVLNAALGYVQESRAEQSMAALTRLSAPTVRVRREGGVHEVSAREIVPADVVLLETGTSFPLTGDSCGQPTCGCRRRR